MRYFYLFTLTILCLTACQSKKKDAFLELTPVDTVIPEAKFPPLESGEVFLKEEDPFHGIIDLKGENVVADTFIFKPKESRMFISGDRMIMKNFSTSGDLGFFLIFKYPEMTFIQSAGVRGNGANEFVYPDLVPSADTSLLCYVYDSPKKRFNKLDKNGQLTPYEFEIRSNRQNSVFGSVGDLVNLGSDDFIYIDDSKTGKSIFRSTKAGDSIQTKEVISLQLNPKRKSPFTYIGDFGVNLAKNRMVYAYKYFKVLKFMDLEANTVRTLNFQQTGFDDGTLGIMDGLDQNVTHYWGMCAQEDYVYCLYSGRTPMEVGRESSKGNHYIYVEQFDWNGNPVKKYKLDKWGYFCVDEKGKKIWLTSMNFDDPFFVFNLP